MNYNYDVIDLRSKSNPFHTPVRNVLKYYLTRNIESEEQKEEVDD